MSIITLTTDFGTRDYFVAAVKGVLLRQAPNSQLIDVTHEVCRHNIVSGAFILQEIFPYFPEATVHLVVVDPGVGTERRKIIVCLRGQFFVAPDNGLLSYLLQDKAASAFEVTNSAFLRFSESPTFAGRDHFAPIAACLARGVTPSELGHEIDDAKVIDALVPTRREGLSHGRIVYFDCFGNAITNLKWDFLSNDFIKTNLVSLTIRGQNVRGLRNCYADGTLGELAMIINSSGYLELFSFQGSAKDLLDLDLLDEVSVSVAQVC